MLSVDIVITAFLRHLVPHTPLFDTLFTILSFHGINLSLFIIFIVFLLIVLKKFEKKTIIPLAMSLITTWILVEYILKIVFNRLRPIIDASEHILFTCPSTYSFPSGHAAISFSAAYILSNNDKKRAPLYYTFAVLISYSRIYLGCHYISDVVAGAILGTLISIFIKKYCDF